MLSNNDDGHVYNNVKYKLLRFSETFEYETRYIR